MHIPSNAVSENLLGSLALPDEFSGLNLLGLALRLHHFSGETPIGGGRRAGIIELSAIAGG